MEYLSPGVARIIFQGYPSIPATLSSLTLHFKVKLCFILYQENTESGIKLLVLILTLKAPITTAVDDIFCDTFPKFLTKIRYDIT